MATAVSAGGKLLAILVILAAWPPAYGQVSVAPALPTVQDTVRVKVPANALSELYDPGSTSVAMAGTRITVTLGLIDFIRIPSTRAVDWPIGQFPAGTFQVEVWQKGNVIGATEFTVAPRPARGPLWNHTDMWWNPDESGWGLSIVQHGAGNIMAGFLMYGADNSPTWFLVSGGRWELPTRFSGTLYRTVGPQVLEAFDPSGVTATPVGAATFDFSDNDPNRAVLTLSVDGRTIQKAIQRLPY